MPSWPHSRTSPGLSPLVEETKEGTLVELGGCKKQTSDMGEKASLCVRTCWTPTGLCKNIKNCNYDTETAIHMQNQLQVWSGKVLPMQKRCSPWSKKFIVLYSSTSRLLMHMLNSLWSIATATSNQVNRIVISLCFFRQFFCPCERTSCVNLNSSKRFHKTKISYCRYSTEYNDVLYLLQGSFYWFLVV